MTAPRRIGTALALALIAVGALGAGIVAPVSTPTHEGGAVLALHAPTAHAADPPASKQAKPNNAQQYSAWWAADTIGAGLAKLFAFVASLFAWLLGVAALLLDFVVYYTVVQMGGFMHHVSGVNVAWGILRDIGNIVLIFGFLASGIMVILDTSQYGFGSKLLPMLLISAILLNFSLLISEAVVDVGNFFAVEVFAQINNGHIPTPKQVTGGISAVSNEGISNRLMDVLKLQTAYKQGGTTGTTALKDSAVTSFMMMLLFIVAAFVFFSLAFVLMARFVALILLIVASPIGFAGLAIPGLSSFAKKWWHQLVNQTLTAPALLLLLYVALAIITSANFLTNAGGSASTSTTASVWDSSNLTGFIGNILIFTIAMALLLAVVIAAKQLGAIGANVAVKFGGKISGFNLATRTIAAVPGFAGRNTIGLGGVVGGRAWRHSGLARVPILGRAGAAVFDKAAKASFEARPSSGTAKVAGLDFNLGKPQKGGAAEAEKQAIKAREAHAKTLEQTKEEKAAQKAEENRKKMMEQTVRDIEAQNDREMDQLLREHRVDLGLLRGEVADRRDDLREAERAGGEASIHAAQVALNNALLGLQEQRTEQQREQQELKGVHDHMVAVQNAEVKAHEQNIENLKAKPAETYARRIAWQPPYVDRLPFGGWPIGKGRYVNEKAAENIRKEARKKQSEREMDSIRRLLEREEEGGGGTAGAEA